MSSDLRVAPKRKGFELERSRAPAEAIFTSSGNNDSGLWDPSLRDERYLPFEGAGAVNSKWQLELPATIRQFDYSSISDVVLHIRYTAEPGSDSKKEMEDDLAAQLEKAPKVWEDPLWVYTSLQSDLADQFAALQDAGDTKTVRLRLPPGLARWMGQPVLPTGRVKIALLGTTAGATPTVRLNDILSPANAIGERSDFWSADFADLKSLIDPGGFELAVQGISRLRDVVIFLQGRVSR